MEMDIGDQNSVCLPFCVSDVCIVTKQNLLPLFW